MTALERVFLAFAAFHSARKLKDRLCIIFNVLAALSLPVFGRHFIGTNLFGAFYALFYAWCMYVTLAHGAFLTV